MTGETALDDEQRLDRISGACVRGLIGRTKKVHARCTNLACDCICHKPAMAGLYAKSWRAASDADRKDQP